ncbi:ATP-binding protein [Tumebacillus permanentifrigoris]|uniref:histidine kinase n=1 Tax=Tumebacillus permanentifrigoris TaxID=378543 RepID=A0A316D4V1_9BACL|nr:ATP-binding protein [Tumebacillus permanentifrigoris]PWK07949.1 signal transduction histidine kinase [Tumebacillus permanentifrigoris]
MKNNAIKKGIARRITNYMLVLILLIMVGGGAMYVVEHKLQTDYYAEVNQLDQKSKLSIQIQQHTLSVIADMRGYLAVAVPSFIDKIHVKQKGWELGMQEFRKLDLTEEDRQYLEDLQKGYDKVFNEIVPAAVKMTDAATNRAELLKYSQDNNFTPYLDSLFQHNSDYVVATRVKIDALQAKYNRNLDLLAILTSCYLVVIAAIVGWLAIRFAKDVGQPLQRLALSSQHHEDGKLLELPYGQRSDEIGFLTRSLQSMIRRIKETEQNLIEQNEEVLAQQEELLHSQDELSETLLKMQQKEAILQAQNELNASLVNTLNRTDLLQSIIQNVRVIQHADKGAIVLLEEDHPHAAVGIKPEQMHRFIDTLEDSMLARLQMDGRAFVLSREALPREKGYHDERIELSDLYLPIHASDGRMIALVVLTRMGRNFSEAELEQSRALANQISLSIEKLHTFEASERERRLNQEIINSIREGVQLFDKQGNLVQVNETWTSWIGEYVLDSDDREVTHRLYDLFEKLVDNSDELCEFVKEALDGTLADDAKLIYQLQQTDSTKVIQVYYEKIHDARDHVVGTMLVHRDITREYEVDQMKSEFVSTVSHELRTPLSSVLGFTELMLNKELKPDRQHKYLTTIHKEAKRLTQLINDFLDIQRMESGRQSYDMADVEMLPIVQEVMESFTMNYTKHTLRVVPPAASTFVRGDADKLKQVLVNLIGNAVKYSPEGGEVTVEFRCLPKTLVVIIRDQGLGIPRDALSKLFSKFYRIDNSDRRKIGGTGLGLAICKEIVKAHDGEITVQSELGIGSMFSIHLPRQDVTVPVLAAYSEVAVALTTDQPRLFIVEDDDSLALLLQEELQDNGFTVTHLRDGEVAVDQIAQHLPDAVVLDIMLKDSISGWDVIDRLKANEATKNIPIFIASALDDRELGLSKGATDFLTKPYQPSKLSNVILQTLLHREKTGVIMFPEREEDQ